MNRTVDTGAEVHFARDQCYIQCPDGTKATFYRQGRQSFYILLPFKELWKNVRRKTQLKKWWQRQAHANPQEGSHIFRHLWVDKNSTVVYSDWRNSLLSADRSYCEVFKVIVFGEMATQPLSLQKRTRADPGRAVARVFPSMERPLSEWSMVQLCFMTISLFRWK